jgi:hypothetical protein
MDGLFHVFHVFHVPCIQTALVRSALRSALRSAFNHTVVHPDGRLTASQISRYVRGERAQMPRGPVYIQSGLVILALAPCNRRPRIPTASATYPERFPLTPL